MNTPSLPDKYPQPFSARFCHACVALSLANSNDAALSSCVQSTSPYIINPLKSHWLCVLLGLSLPFNDSNRYQSPGRAISSMASSSASINSTVGRPVFGSILTLSNLCRSEGDVNANFVTASLVDGFTIVYVNSDIDAINKIELAKLHRQNTFVEFAFALASSELSKMSSTRSLSSASTPGPTSTFARCSYAPTACSGGSSPPKRSSNRVLSSPSRSSSVCAVDVALSTSSSSIVNCARLDILRCLCLGVVHASAESRAA
mmetsp:Transcript_3064/g.10335  ORF Transcript_3064/g.10335 Transcript_3064/m.10335 type:complete len:260 (+) Transcript_3064:418-1197(+)